jgi:hypothetical protein
MSVWHRRRYPYVLHGSLPKTFGFITVEARKDDISQGSHAEHFTEMLPNAHILPFESDYVDQKAYYLYHSASRSPSAVRGSSASLKRYSSAPEDEEGPVFHIISYGFVVLRTDPGTLQFEQDRHSITSIGWNSTSMEVVFLIVPGFHSISCEWESRCSHCRLICIYPVGRVLRRLL